MNRSFGNRLVPVLALLLTLLPALVLPPAAAHAKPDKSPRFSVSLSYFSLNQLALSTHSRRAFLMISRCPRIQTPCPAAKQ
jgi:hypothetical protein